MTLYYRTWSLLFLLSLVFRTALPIKCMTCESPVEEALCDNMGSRETCKESLASKQFNFLRTFSKELTEPVRNTGYQCMELKVAEASKLVKGCIYANLDVCASFPKAKTCLLCKEDDCNSKAYKDGGLTLGGSTAFLMVMVVLVGLFGIWYN